MKFRGYRQGQAGGGCLVSIVDDFGDERVMGLPPIKAGREFRHSPDGFQWGYAGSGPAELARAILIAAVPDDDRVRYPLCYQKFKAEAIATIRRDEFVIEAKAVQEWYEAWLVEHGERVERGWLDA